MSTPEGVSRDDFARLEKAVAALADARKEEKDEPTPSHKTDVRDAKADLRAVARELGVSVEKLEQAAAQVRRDERKQELRELLDEIKNETPAADDDDEDGDGDGEGDDGKDGKDEKDEQEEWT
jgi:uncharacterized membrane protein